MAFSEDVANWLSAALQGKDGKDRMTKAALAKKAGVSEDTIFRYLGGDGGSADQKTLNKLAKALGVPAPQIERTLRTDGRVTAPPTPLALVRLASGTLRRAERLLATSATVDPIAREIEDLASDMEGDEKPA